MNEEVKSYAKIGLKSGFRWFLLAGFGGFIAALFFVVIFMQGMGAAAVENGAGKEGMLEFIRTLGPRNPFGAIVFFGGPIFLLSYIFFANKVAIQTIIHEIWSKKAMHHVEPAVKGAVEKYVAENDWANNQGARLRGRLLETSFADPNIHALSRKVIRYALKKINLDDIDLKKSDLGVGDLVASRVVAYVSESAEPSFRWYWIILGLHGAVFACSQTFGAK